MKLEFLSFDFDKFAQEMQSLKDKKGFDYLVTIVGEDFGEEGLGCVYILENSKTHERCSVKMIAKAQVCGDGMSSNGTGDTDGQMVAYLPTVSNIWRVADLLGTVCLPDTRGNRQVPVNNIPSSKHDEKGRSSLSTKAGKMDILQTGQ